MPLFLALLSPCSLSTPEVLGQSDEEAELSTEMLDNLEEEEEGPEAVHPGERLQSIYLFPHTYSL